MVIKASNKGHESVAMNLFIDWTSEEIGIEIKAYLKHGKEEYVYDASDFKTALDKFNELDEILRIETRGE